MINEDFLFYNYYNFIDVFSASNVLALNHFQAVFHICYTPLKLEVSKCLQGDIEVKN